MKTISTILILFTFVIHCQAQSYFPPKTSNTWETVTPASLGWNTGAIDPLLDFLQENNTKAFIVLKDGKIAIEQYFGTFSQDSAWYWASAGKTVTAFLVGVAQQEGKLSISDQTSKYLGKGWTVAPSEKEDLITIWHQLTMTSGLDDNIPPTPAVPDPANCLEPSCLIYKADAGTRWSYHNAPYRLLEDVVPAATGQTWQQYTNQKLKQQIGMTTGAWINYVFWSRPRDMARFGLLILNKGIWENEVILSDTAYFRQMVNTSQSLNKSYGYLWWLNGKGQHMLPGPFQFIFDEDLIPAAPDDVFAALGKNDQKIYISPGQNIVVIRMGDSAGESKEALSSFDNQLWEKLNQVFNSTTPVSQSALAEEIHAFPNPGNDWLFLQISNPATQIIEIQIFDFQGKKVNAAQGDNSGINVVDLPKGIYVLNILTNYGMHRLRWVKQ